MQAPAVPVYPTVEEQVIGAQVRPLPAEAHVFPAQAVHPDLLPELVLQKETPVYPLEQVHILLEVAPLHI